MKRTITITYDDSENGHIWDVHENGKCCNGLGWDEMLGQVIMLTISPERVGQGFAMKTSKEWDEHFASRVLKRQDQAAPSPKIDFAA